MFICSVSYLLHSLTESIHSLFSFAFKAYVLCKPLPDKAAGHMHSIFFTIKFDSCSIFSIRAAAYIFEIHCWQNSKINSLTASDLCVLHSNLSDTFNAVKTVLCVFSAD